MKCSDLVVGSAYSRRGTNRFDECEHEAKYHVVVDFTAIGRSVHHHDVCGVHVRKYRAMVEREQRNSRWIEPSSKTTIKEIK